MSTVKLLFGTGNQAKLSAMRSRLKKLGIELIGLNDLKTEGKHIPEVAETGLTPLENARLKALAYYEAFRMPVFSCDSGLYFEGVPDEVQPGVHVRTVNGSCLSDEEMREYYAGLVKQYGTLTATYRNAICFVMDENHIYEAMDPSMESEKFLLTDVPHSAIRKKGFPLDSMSIDMKTGKYYYDLAEDELEQFAVEDGVLRFFEKILEEKKMLFIEYPKCSTCKKAKSWLDERGIAYTDRHIAEENPSYEELKEWHEKSGLPLKRFFNTSGNLYKALHLKDRLADMSEEEQLKLLASDGMLVKRPLIVDGDTVMTGFREAEWEEKLG